MNGDCELIRTNWYLHWHKFLKAGRLRWVGQEARMPADQVAKSSSMCKTIGKDGLLDQTNQKMTKPQILGHVEYSVLKNGNKNR